MPYLAGSFATVDEVRESLSEIRVVPVVEPALGIPAPVHYAISDASGDEIVVEYLDGALVVHEDPIGVMTNAPSYDWHLTNPRNYIDLQQTDLPPLEADGISLPQLGVGSGLLGLPGDYTPPSRFVRAAVWRSTSRETAGGFDTTREQFRILDNFNLPLEGAGELPEGREPLEYGATQYTVSFDTANLRMYYHTDDDRTLRVVDMNALDWSGIGGFTTTPMRLDAPPTLIEVAP